jgi:hypothetical protein
MSDFRDRRVTARDIPTLPIGILNQFLPVHRPFDIIYSTIPIQIYYRLQIMQVEFIEPVLNA